MLQKKQTLLENPRGFVVCIKTITVTTLMVALDTFLKSVKTRHL